MVSVLLRPTAVHEFIYAFTPHGMPCQLFIPWRDAFEEFSFRTCDEKHNFKVNFTDSLT